ncbi:3534_t:CDS:1, partial [Scutellospora calospora]
KAKSEIELHLLVAISTYYQQVFGTKTEYSDLAIMGFENEIVNKQLIADIVFFLIFFYIDKLNRVVSSIGNLYKDRFYSIGTRFVSSFIACYHGE